MSRDRSSTRMSAYENVNNIDILAQCLIIFLLQVELGPRLIFIKENVLVCWAWPMKIFEGKEICGLSFVSANAQ